MNEVTIYNVISGIDENLIESSMKQNAKPTKKIVALTMCLLLIVCAILCVPSIIKFVNRATPSDTPFGTNRIAGGGDWSMYSTFGEIVDASTEIYSGKITKVSSDFLDQTTGKTDKLSGGESADSVLYILYTVEVTDSYKGENVPEKVICIIETEEISPLKIGSEYLFCTVRTEGDYDHVINPVQFAYSLDSENAKKIINLVK